jgi:outer membrane receptor protein involved in Fe transport
VFTEAIENNRSDMVPLINIRLDKRFPLPHGTFTLMGDFYNILNSNAVLNFNVRSGSAWNRIIQALDPMTFMLGLRYEY